MVKKFVYDLMWVMWNVMAQCIRSKQSFIYENIGMSIFIDLKAINCEIIRFFSAAAYCNLEYLNSNHLCFVSNLFFIADDTVAGQF